jgi:Rha family phage regulatory protein
VREVKAFADSREVAATFKKSHAHVLRDIRELACSEEFKGVNFGSFNINDLIGESTSHVEMTRDGFMFLAMGFTGAKSAAWNERLGSPAKIRA